MATSNPVAAPAPKSAEPSNDSGIKETIESILIAFILAFIFRAYVVEAFVIPTGSMAPTLLGAHMRYHCSDCGYKFTVNYSAETKNGDINIPQYATEDYKAYCPNCGFRVPTPDPEDQLNDASRPPLHYGDRILVLKYLYLFNEPQRWDVIVFKSPEPTGAPAATYDYSVNYIKRLIAKPGESVLILDGDVYISPRPSSKAEDFEVQPKPKWAQDALWRIVYDNDFHPQGRRRAMPWVQPWVQREGFGWNTGGEGADARKFKFDNLNSEGRLEFDANANPDKHSLTDWLAYDTDAYLGGAPAPVPVSDVKLDLFYERHSGDLPLRLRLTKANDVFIAEITPTSARLLRQSTGSEIEIGKAAFADTHRPMHVELSNADYKVSLSIDGNPLITSTRDNYRPDISKLVDDHKQGRRTPAATVAIIAARQQCTLSHVSLWRDVYYISKGVERGSADSPQKFVHLNADEYFALGDNSAISGDARFWKVPINLPAEDLKVDAGRVPARFMLGRAFFVYWPAGYRPLDNAPALVPDFGDMRFIR